MPDKIFTLYDNLLGIFCNLGENVLYLFFHRKTKTNLHLN